MIECREDFLRKVVNDHLKHQCPFNISFRNSQQVGYPLMDLRTLRPWLAIFIFSFSLSTALRAQTDPTATVWLVGDTLIEGGTATVTVATALVADPATLVTTTW